MSTNDRPPNLLLLVTDQERHDLVGEGGPPVETPNLDRLRASGVAFTRAYTPISICSSARASMLSGRYPHAHGVLNNVHEADALRADLPADVPTFGERLRDAGYTNTYIGKWHVGRDRGPAAFGFEYLGGSDRHHDEALESGFRDYQRELGVEPDDVEIEDAVHATFRDERFIVAGRTPVPVEATRAYYLAERTIERLASVDGDRPFLHRTDFVGPHHPYVVPEPYASMYDPADLEPWPSYAETFADKPQVQENYLAYRGVESFDWDDWSALLARYMGFMTLIDEQAGRILSAVEELDLGGDTIVVHASDHGDFVGSHRQFNKGPFMYEDTYRVPLAVAGPGVDAGRECDELVSLVDLMPTVLETAGEPVPDGVQGRSLRPLLEGEAPDWRDAVFAEYHGDEFGLYSQRMVRTGRYKLVYNAPDVDELYDLRADPAELRNLAGHPAYRAVRRRLSGALLEWMDRTDDPLYRWTARHLRDDAPDADG